MADCTLSSGVYVLRNTLDGKVYVGSATNLERRRNDHYRMLRGGYHHSRHLQAAYCRDGEEAFKFSVLDYVPSELLISTEQRHIDQFHAADRRYGYNSRPKAESNVGRKCSAQTLEKMRLANLGKKQSPETVRKRTAHQKGRKLPKEWSDAISAGKMGGKRPDVARCATRYAMFDDDQIVAIRADRAVGMTYEQLGVKYGCRQSTAQRVVNGLGPAYSRIV